MICVNHRQEASWLVTEVGLSISEFMRRGLHGENVCSRYQSWVACNWKTTLPYQYSPILCSLLVRVSFIMGVAYQLNYVFQIIIRSYTYMLCRFPSKTCSIIENVLEQSFTIYSKNTKWKHRCLFWQGLAADLRVTFTAFFSQFENLGCNGSFGLCYH